MPIQLASHRQQVGGGRIPDSLRSEGNSALTFFVAIRLGEGGRRADKRDHRAFAKFAIKFPPRCAPIYRAYGVFPFLFSQPTTEQKTEEVPAATPEGEQPAEKAEEKKEGGEAAPAEAAPAEAGEAAPAATEEAASS